MRRDVEAITRVCVYNRAATGSSDAPLSFPRTTQDMVNDLHILLNKANVIPPYILVGHSFGGLVTTLYAGQYPTEVVGMVLVESSQYDQGDRILEALPPDAFEEYEYLQDIKNYYESPLDSIWNITEKVDFLKSWEQVRTVKTLGDMPLVVLTRNPDHGFSAGAIPIEYAEKLEQAWQEGQANLKNLSSNGSQVISTKGTHSLQLTDYQLTIDTIKKMLEEIRSQ